MRTPLLIGIVAVAHGVAVGSVMLIQGCGTTGPVLPPPEPVMPGAEKAVVMAPPAPVIPPVKSWPGETTVYVVKSGDTLSVIAQKFDLSVAEIAALNSISNPDLVRIGQNLILPGRVNVGSPKPVKRKTTVRPPAGGAVYVVKPGDSLSAIAVRLGTTVAALKEANGLTGDKILVGQKLVIPAGARRKVDVPAPGIPEVKVGEEPADGPPAAAEIPEVLPPAIERAAHVPAVETGTAGKSVSFRMHEVEGGEDLYSVAMMFAVSVSELKELNGLTDTSLTPGQRLKIPMSE